MGRQETDDNLRGRATRTVLRAAWIAAIAFCSAFAPTASYGAGSAEVLRAQQTLQALGYSVGTPDGYLGPRTTKAVRAFQGVYGLPSTGNLDDQTLSVLSSSSTAPATTEPSSPPTSASDTGGPVTGLVWLFIIIGGVAWFVRSRGKMPANKVSPNVVEQIYSTPSAVALQSKTSLETTSGSAAVGAGKQARWIAGTEHVQIGRHTMNCGMIYVGERLVRQSGYIDENCLINPTLAVATTNANVDGAGMSYWPTYAGLSPLSRLAYLNWLAGDRNDPTTYIGYVFLYFYGLERRLFADIPGEEARAIVTEVKRLKDVYGANHSFDRYATAFIESATLALDLPLAMPTLTLRKSSWSVPLSVRVGIGKLLAEGKNIPADWALAWYTSAQDRRVPLAASRCESEFIALFRRRFQDQFPGGLPATTAKRLSAEYRAASATFVTRLHGAFEKYPDVAELTGPLNKCDPIVERCAADLADYSRAIGKLGERRGGVLAATALPVELQNSDAAAPKNALISFLNARIASEKGVLTLQELAGQIDPAFTASPTVTKGNLVSLATALSCCGFGLEPDPRMASGSQPLDSEVVVFQMPKVQPLSDCRPEYLSALALADVGAIVAAADGIIHPEERIAFTAALEANTALTVEERQRLNARFELYTRTPPTLRVLNRFKDAPNAQREAVAKLAVAIAAADGTIAVEEMRVLERIYKSFSLPQERLYADVHAARRDENFVTIAEHDTGKSVPIPMAPNRGKPLALNAAKLAKIRADTAVVTSILGDIFEGETEHSVSASPSAVAHKGLVGTPFDGLDAQHTALLSELMRTGHVDIDEFAERAAKHGLLTEGAIEVINDWAFDRFGGPIIEDDDGFRIDRQVFETQEAKVA